MPVSLGRLRARGEPRHLMFHGRDLLARTNQFFDEFRFRPAVIVHIPASSFDLYPVFQHYAENYSSNVEAFLPCLSKSPVMFLHIFEIGSRI
jgi:hypothetical protein